MDHQGTIWVFVSDSRRDGEILKSRRPYEIDAFDPAARFAFKDPQAWHIAGKGIVLVCVQPHNRHRALCCTTSPDGIGWSKPAVLAEIEHGCDAVSWCERGKVGIAFDYRSGHQNDLTGLYYLESSDAGKSWVTSRHETVQLPLKARENAARVFDYESSGQSVYLQDVNFDRAGNPTLLYLVAPVGSSGAGGTNLSVNRAGSRGAGGSEV